MNKTKYSFWKDAIEAVKSFFTHVNIIYDGTKGSIHIDIIPTEQQRHIPERQEVISSQ